MLTYQNFGLTFGLEFFLVHLEEIMHIFGCPENNHVRKAPCIQNWIKPVCFCELFASFCYPVLNTKLFNEIV